ncbi:MAG TPA: efflux RND transporter periplasmic adaptor subunit [Gemmatimonadales bacterium]|nr:efflux RND transporter periplasmic adaptor subunit [Gemmatimonadales bacterium]
MPKQPRLLHIALVFSAACSGARANSTTDRPYRVGVADTGAIRVLVDETGIVEPERQIVVKSPISGVVERLHVREGDRVAPGQMLARILPDIAQSNTLSRLQSERVGAQIALDRAQRDFDRAEQLAKGGGITQEEFEQKRTAFEQARNQLKTAEDQIRLVELSGVNAADTAQWARITSPSAGVIIIRGVEEGETVVGGTSAYGGGTELFTIADLSALRVKSAINEVDIGKVAVGDSVALTVDAFPDDTILGLVRLVPPAARLQERVRVFDVEIRVVGSGPLRPGMTANVKIRGPVRTGVIRVPVESVFLVEGKPIVYRLRGAEPERVPVRLGLSDLGHVEIIEGVSPGDSLALEDPVAAAERAQRISRPR